MRGMLQRWGHLALAISLGLSSAARAQTTAEQQTYQQRMRLLFERLDRNNDQRLQRQEVQGQPYLERHFDRLDSRKRGYLGPDDLTPSQATRGERTKRFFEQADRNGDGSIDRREAEAYSWLQRHFGQADRNGDGRVDRQELQGLSEQRRRQLSTPTQP
jgi:Ca2+-binding EF-hand superfamily protein